MSPPSKVYGAPTNAAIRPSVRSSRGGDCGGMSGTCPPIFRQGIAMIHVPKKLTSRCMPLSSLNPFSSTAKVAPKMHQSKTHLFKLRNRKFFWRGALGMGTPLPTPYSPRRLGRLDPRAYGARPPNLQHKSPPLRPSLCLSHAFRAKRCILGIWLP